MRTSVQGKARLKSFEGFRQYAYPDPASALYRAFPSKKWGFSPASAIQVQEEYRHLSGHPWTVGYGFTKGITPDTVMSVMEADVRLADELVEYEEEVFAACTVRPTQNQFDAMVCLAWNIGWPRFKTSTVLKAHNRGDFLSASRAFGLWNMANGRVDKGLTSRRAAESVLYLKPEPSMARRVAESVVPSAEASEVPGIVEMPQTVDSESTMAQSPINRTAVIAGGTTAIAAVTETVNTVSSLKYGIDSLGQWLVPVLLIAVVGMIGYIIWHRFNQRKQGWG